MAKKKGKAKRAYKRRAVKDEPKKQKYQPSQDKPTDNEKSVDPRTSEGLQQDVPPATDPIPGGEVEGIDNPVSETNETQKEVVNQDPNAPVEYINETTAEDNPDTVSSPPAPTFVPEKPQSDREV